MAGGKKKSRGAAVAAHAASKKKSAAVEFTADNEARVRDALAGLSLGQAAHTQKSVNIHQVGQLYDRLLEHGFQPQNVQRALQALHGGDMSEEAALDWLCLHVDPAQLPRRFAGSARSRAATAGIKVLVKAENKAPQPRQVTEPVEDSASWRKPQSDPAEDARAAKEAQQRDKESQRAWIMQYMENDSSSDDEAGLGGNNVIEEWEMWGDPREIERRKVERKRASIPPEQRRLQLAQEWVRAKAEAAKAKSAADRARQKATGVVIRDLKLEMKQLGLTEEEANSLGEPASQESGGALDGDWPILGAAEEPDEVPEPMADKEDHDDGPPVETPIEGNREMEGSKAENSGSGSENSDFGGALDLFDNMTVASEPAGGVGTHPPKLPPPPPVPWGHDSGKRNPKKKGAKGSAALPKPETKAPKAILQQFCHKEQKPPPTFEKLPPGGNRLTTAGIRYSVTVEEQPQKGGKKKAASQRLYCLKEDEDGWETIQDAQNAVATLALYHVMTDRSIWHSLPKDFQDIWLAWDQQGGASSTLAADNGAAKQQFVEWLSNQSPTNAESAAPARPGTSELLPKQELRQSRSSAASLSKQREAAERESRSMLERLATFRESDDGRKWFEYRQGLPVSMIKDDLLKALASHDVVVVGGDTGCGKTTQVPQYLLDASIEAGQGGRCSVICTQPRRIAAISVAERVCQERLDPPPGKLGSTVGYHVRLDAASTKETKLLFCTTGILLRRLASDPLLEAVSHVIVDEVHERALQGDFLMALLKDIVAARRAQGNPLKVVLMSATLDSDLFARYFGQCPMLAAGGRTFPVEHVYLEDVYELIGYRLDPEGPAALRVSSDASKRKALQKAAGNRQSLVKAGWGDDEADAGATNPHYRQELYSTYSAQTRKSLSRLDEHRIDYDLLEELTMFLVDSPEEGAILIFLPGMGEINNMYERLTSGRSFREGRQWVLPLHSSVSPQEQRRAFEIPPKGVRKIVLATNIAETSLTISDVSFVIDSGKLKERRHDASRGMSLLLEDWVSRANALQRKGRAGRVRAGKCFGLYTRHRFEARMRPYQAPEMVRLPLEELVLQIHLLGLGAASQFLEKVIEPPPTKSVKSAITQLQAVGALTSQEQLTPLGHHLAQLPVDARVGKLLLMGASLECLSPILTIAACLSYKTPFSAPLDQQEAVQRLKVALAAPGHGSIAAGQQSDHLLMAAVYQGWAHSLTRGGRREGAAYARKNMVSQQTLEMLADMRWQFATMLADSRFILPPSPHSRSNSASRNWIDDLSQPWNKHALKPPLVKAVLCAALYPNIAVMDDSAGKFARPAWNDGISDVFIHPSSVNHMLEAHRFLRPYITFLEKVKTSRTFLGDCTVVSPMALLLFGGDLEVRHEEGYVLIDGWIRVRAAAPTAVLVKKLRLALDGLLQQKIGRPEMDLSSSAGDLVDTLVKLLNDEESSQHWDR